MSSSANEGDVRVIRAVFRDLEDPALPSVDPDTVECRVKHGDDAVVTRVYGVDASLTRHVADNGDITYKLLEPLERPTSYVAAREWTVTYRWVATGVGGTSRWRSFSVSVAPI